MGLTDLIGDALLEAERYLRSHSEEIAECVKEVEVDAPLSKEEQRLQWTYAAMYYGARNGRTKKEREGAVFLMGVLRHGAPPALEEKFSDLYERATKPRMRVIR